MKGQRIGVWEWIGASVVVALLLLLGITAAVGWRWLDDPNTAAWVQAFGSIGAIFATGWGVHWSHVLASQHAAAVAVRDAIEKKRQILALLRGLEEVVVGYADGDHGPFSRDLGQKLLADMESLADALGGVDYATLSAGEVISATTGNAVARKLASQVRQMLITRTMLDNEHLRDSCRELTVVLRKYIRRMEVSIGRFMEEHHATTRS